MLLNVILIAVFSTPTVAAEPSTPRQIVLQQHGHGMTLTDDKGMTLYTYEKDVEPGKSQCVNACAKQWPPLLVTSDEDGASKDWSIITRADGAKQWAFHGKPLYYYSNDAKPGDANGDGVANLWQIGFQAIPSPPGIGIQRTRIGYVLSDQKKMTIYSFEKDKANGSGCDNACMRTWMPLWAPTVAHGFGDWSVISRKDGSRQWAFRGKPIYRYAQDAHPAETSGENASKGWHAVVLEPPPPNPSWITIQQSDAGEVLADAQGRTLYAWDANQQFTIIKGSVENPAFDRPDDWIPVPVAGDAKPIGSWSIVERNGEKRWAYKGMPLYVNKNDVTPGDLFGVRGGNDMHFKPITPTGTL